MVTYYTPSLIVSFGFDENTALIVNIILGLFMVLVTAATMPFIDKIGRKTLLFIGSVGCSVSYILVSISLSLFKDDSIGFFLCVFSIVLSIIFFNPSWGMVVWILFGEIFPLNVRGLANSIATALSWISSLIVTFIFPILLDIIDACYLIFAFAMICFFAALFIKFKVFETRNRTLEEIEDELRQRAGVE